MAKSIVSVPSGQYQPGTRTVDVPNLSSDDKGIEVAFTRESWPSGDSVLSGVIEGSNDGATWFELSRFDYPGGDQINPRTGQPVTASMLRVYWPERNDGSGNFIPQRPQGVRSSITNSVVLRTAITLRGL